MKRKIAPAILAFSLLQSVASFAEVDPALPDYKRASGVSGNVISIGSDTLNNLMTLWAEEFKRIYPNVSIQIQGAGSSTAPPALVEGTANFGPMSRAMKEGEIAAFEKKYGYKPTAIGVAIDALAVYVHKDNPIRGLTLQQVDAIFSATRRCGYNQDITTWGQLGMTGEWANRPIQLFGRNSVSGTYGFFKKNALCNGDFKSTVNEQPGSASVVQGVTASLNGIGYSGIGYRTSGVKAVALSKQSSSSAGEFFEPTAANAVSGRFPLARFLWIYVNKHPNRPADPIVMEFIRMLLSRQGQEVVVKDGYVPLPAAAAKKERAKLGK